MYNKMLIIFKIPFKKFQPLWDSYWKYRSFFALYEKKCFVVLLILFTNLSEMSCLSRVARSVQTIRFVLTLVSCYKISLSVYTLNTFISLNSYSYAILLSVT